MEKATNKSFVKILYTLVIAIVAISLVFILDIKTPNPKAEIPSQDHNDKLKALYEEAIQESGFVNDTGVINVIQNCTNCHSSKLVTQNRMSREGWEASIDWMQETQNLWELGDNRQIIVDYLTKHYSPKAKGRRTNLSNIEWYELP